MFKLQIENNVKKKYFFDEFENTIVTTEATNITYGVANSIMKRCLRKGCSSINDYIYYVTFRIKNSCLCS